VASQRAEVERRSARSASVLRVKPSLRPKLGTRRTKRLKPDLTPRTRKRRAKEVRS
jgi:hypothetical protein